MSLALKTMPAPQSILHAWLPFQRLVRVTTIHTKREYEYVRKIVEALLDEIGEDEKHPLADVLDFLSDKMKVYEDEHVGIPDAEPHDILRYLMEEHGLKQGDLSDCAPQGRISDILGGKRPISKETAKKLARRFRVHADLFL